MAEATFNKLTSAHFYAWEQGLKTGQYYLRTRPAKDAIKFTLNVESLLKNSESSSMFDHLNSKNLSEAEMKEQRRVKKRKIVEISNSNQVEVEPKTNTVVKFKEPEPVKKTAQEIKECPFNPFGDDSCDMCGS